MGDPKIARTVAEAEVGDLLWQLDVNANRYDENKKYLGRGVWTIVTVTEVRRQYLKAGYYDYNRNTGAGRTQNGYSPSMLAYGSEERQSNWWKDRRYAIAQAVKDCNDRETLKAVAFALGLEGPPDFSVVPPTDPTPQKDSANG